MRLALIETGVMHSQAGARTAIFAVVRERSRRILLHASQGLCSASAQQKQHVCLSQTAAARVVNKSHLHFLLCLLLKPLLIDHTAIAPYCTNLESVRPHASYKAILMQVRSWNCYVHVLAEMLFSQICAYLGGL